MLHGDQRAGRGAQGVCVRHEDVLNQAAAGAGDIWRPGGETVILPPGYDRSVTNGPGAAAVNVKIR